MFWHIRYSHFIGRQKLDIIKVTQLPVLWFLGDPHPARKSWSSDNT